MKNLVLSIGLFFYCMVGLAPDTNAQVFYRRSEYGFALGGSNYFGDLNQQYSFVNARYSAGVFLKYNFTNYIALKLAGNYARIGFADKHSSNIYQQTRNLDFTSQIFESVLQAEFNFFQYDVLDFDHRFTPYITFGIGLFSYNPFTTYDNKIYYLRALGTEGQQYEQYKDRRYGQTAIAFPIGAGFKFWVDKGVTFGFEVCNRSTTTDYIDDVSKTYVGIDKFIDQDNSPYPTPSSLLQDRSPETGKPAIGLEGRQRGISSTLDKYMMMQFTLSFRFPTYKCPNFR